MSESWFGHNFSTVATRGEERGKRQRRHEYSRGGEGGRSHYTLHMACAVGRSLGFGRREGGRGYDGRKEEEDSFALLFCLAFAMHGLGLLLVQPDTAEMLRGSIQGTNNTRYAGRVPL